MKPEEIRKLLGGYATGTLTETERNLLFAAALEDQALFDALADEESLRALLSDPMARGELLAAIDEKNEKNDASEREDWRRARPVALSVQPSPMQASPMPASPLSTNASPPIRTWKSLLSSLTPRRMIVAGAFAVAILIVSAVVSIERGRIAAPVEVAENRQSQPAPEREEAPVKQIAPAQATQPKLQVGNAPAGAVAEKRSIEAAPPVGRRDSPASAQAPAQITAGTAVREFDRAEPLSAVRSNAPAADERQRSTESATNAVKDASKESERKVEEQKDQQVAVAAEEPAIQPARITPAPAAPPPPAAAKKTEESNLASKRKAPLNQGFAAGIMSKSRAAESRFAATVTDINGTIVSINAGTNVGLKNADTLEIVRGPVVLGTVRLTDTRATFAVGSLTRSPGADPPRAGDSVRLQTPGPR